jgi:hypothetical protein
MDVEGNSDTGALSEARSACRPFFPVDATMACLLPDKQMFQTLKEHGTLGLR